MNDHIEDLRGLVVSLRTFANGEDAGGWRQVCMDAAHRIDTALAALSAQAAIPDHPEADGTDAAHPAWWRGHHYTVEAMCRKVNDCLDGRDDGKGVSGEPWESVRRRLIALSAQAEAHPDDAAVDAFAAAMKAKLAEARAKGRGGWRDKSDCPQQRLSDMLRSHVEKGDPRDVANFACFLWNRGEGILPAAQPEAQAGGAEEACYQAYQAVGVMLSDLGLFDTERGQNLLDNLSQARVVHEVLPWDSATPPPGAVPEPCPYVVTSREGTSYCSLNGPSAVPDWRTKAADWLETKAAEQEANNLRWPDHAAAYLLWRERPAIFKSLARELLAAAPEPPK